jgi:membrane protease YdiL (CAAX protease family)
VQADGFAESAADGPFCDGVPVTIGAPGGWYQDPTGATGWLRYWNGSVWTEHVHNPGLPAPPRSASFGGETKRLAIDEPTRRDLVWETRFVMIAFLAPGIAAAVVLLAQHVSGAGVVTRFPVLVAGHPLTNLIVGMFAYLPTACVVPLALLLLKRTGDSPSRLGLAMPKLKTDVVPAFGLIGASFGSEFVVLIFLSPLLVAHSSLVSNTPVGHVPGYYVIWGLMISATTAVAEEVLMNGYLVTRLHELGWTPRSVVILAVILRTSYHIYYGIGFIATVPFAYFMTRSFQKNRRLTRTILAHFLFDAILITIAVLTS